MCLRAHVQACICTYVHMYVRAHIQACGLKYLRTCVSTCVRANKREIVGSHRMCSWRQQLVIRMHAQWARLFPLTITALDKMKRPHIKRTWPPLLDACKGKRTNESMSEWLNKWMTEQVNEWTSEQMSEWMNKWEWITEWLNKWIDEGIN